MFTLTARAISTAIAEARDVDGNTCGPEILPCSAASAQCVERNRPCYGAGSDFVPPCCDPDYYLCICRNANESRCRHRNSRVPRTCRDGRVHECTLDRAEEA